MKASSRYVSADVDTRGFPRAHRSAFWRDHVTEICGLLDFTFPDADRFVGKTRVQSRGDLHLVDFWSSAIGYERPAGGYDKDGHDSLRILLPTAGSTRIVGARDRARIEPGRAAVVSMRRGFRIEQPDYARALILSCPRRLWSAPEPADLILRDLDHGAGAVFRAMLRQASSEALALDPSSFTYIVESAIGVLSCGGTSVSEEDILAQAYAVARQHCDDTDFGPRELAQGLDWSLRTVQYGLRRSSTSPAAVIRDVRLERAMFRLRSPAWAGRTISSIAHASGFGSLSAFNTAFQAVTGCTPLEYREPESRYTS